MSDPQTIDDWINLSRQHETVARQMQTNKAAANQARWHAGIAVECALKAYIMRIERHNQWPSRSSHPELYTHDLRFLRKRAGIELDPSDPKAPSWHVVLQWDRNQGYDPKLMPPAVAKALVDAAFGTNGVVTWLRSKCR